ncbi:hypothetical protein AYO20_04709 [Fonsecaea nubica]|uniref:Major facilitator superfamily (MFS) profile domain-containing protein n=1 Tax=Fonsecaea nubica TaxID=856822 RepID=A0A178D2Z3_9EURO|nr:hypothetical protein AYO20_04709 [Fonsecaea nubica]OAL36047.1 hypothetical protein AYO20_04709 [Fonsecaea nubica]
MSHDDDDSRIEAVGTTKLVNFSEKGDGADKDSSTIVLIPTPTTNPNDPLNWPLWRKSWLSAVTLFWCFMINASIAWTSPAWDLWVAEFPTTYTALNNTQSVLVFTCGIGILFTQPMATKYGRRLPYIIGSVLVLAGLAFGAAMNSINFMWAYMILSGFGSAPSYSLNESSLLDISFLHQRGRLMGIYALVLQCGNFLPPIACGFIVDSQGWRWVLRYLLIFQGISALLIIFSAEETVYPRQSHIPVHVGKPVRRSPVATTTTTTEQHGTARLSTSKDEFTSAERATSATEITDEGPTTASHVVDDTIPIHPYRRRHALITKDPTVKQGYWQLVVSPFPYIGLPAVAWASLIVSFKSFLTSFIFSTQASFFSIPPYNFSAGTMGLMFVALVIGNVIGAVLGGLGADWLILRLARRNRGVTEPEHRLWAFLPVPFCCAGGILMYGLGAHYGLHWIVPCLGLTLIGVAANILIPVAMTYAFDSYSDIFDESVQMINFLRNAVGGALSFAIRPWITASGPKNACIGIAVMLFAVYMTFLPFAVWGKKWRTATAGYYLRITRKNDKWAAAAA